MTEVEILDDQAEPRDFNPSIIEVTMACTHKYDLI